LPEFAEIEFSGIPAKSLSADYSIAVRSHNLVRNRGSKIYPYNENRLKLAVTNSNPDGLNFLDLELIIKLKVTLMPQRF